MKTVHRIYSRQCARYKVPTIIPGIILSNGDRRVRVMSYRDLKFWWRVFYVGGEKSIKMARTINNCALCYSI